MEMHQCDYFIFKIEQVLKIAILAKSFDAILNMFMADKSLRGHDHFINICN